MCCIVKEGDKCAKEETKFRNADVVAVECLRNGRVCRITARWKFESGNVNVTAADKAEKEKSALMGLYRDKYGVEFQRVLQFPNGGYVVSDDPDFGAPDYWCIGDRSTVKIKTQTDNNGFCYVYLIVEDNELMMEHLKIIAEEQELELRRSGASQSEGKDQI